MIPEIQGGGGRGRSRSGSLNRCQHVKVNRTSGLIFDAPKSCDVYRNWHFVPCSDSNRHLSEVDKTTNLGRPRRLCHQRLARFGVATRLPLSPRPHFATKREVSRGKSAARFALRGSRATQFSGIHNGSSIDPGTGYRRHDVGVQRLQRHCMASPTRQGSAKINYPSAETCEGRLSLAVLAR